MTKKEDCIPEPGFSPLFHNSMVVILGGVNDL